MCMCKHVCCEIIDHLNVIFSRQYKIWLKPNAEQQFLYGNHIMKAGLGRITENTEQYQGVIVYNMNDLPLVSFVLSKHKQMQASLFTYTQTLHMVGNNWEWSYCIKQQDLG